MLGHNSLENYYHTVFNMTQHHKWNPEYLDNLFPYELEFNVTLLIRHLKEQEELIGNQKRANK